MVSIKLSVAIFCYLWVSSSTYKINFKDKLHDVLWQCDTICEGSGGMAEFDNETQKCRCILTKHMTDDDIRLMLKNARVLGLLLETMAGKSTKNISKREATSTPKATTTVDEDDDDDAPVVVQSKGKNRAENKDTSMNSPLMPTHIRDATPTSSAVKMQESTSKATSTTVDEDDDDDNAPVVGQSKGTTPSASAVKTQERMNRLEQIRNRFRGVASTSVRPLLKNRNNIIVAPTLRPLHSLVTPRANIHSPVKSISSLRQGQQKADTQTPAERIREHIRQRTEELRNQRNQGHRVGAIHSRVKQIKHKSSDEVSTKDTKVETPQVNTSPKAVIITQDPSLVDDDDK